MVRIPLVGECIYKYLQSVENGNVGGVIKVIKMEKYILFFPAKGSGTIKDITCLVIKSLVQYVYIQLNVFRI